MLPNRAFSWANFHICIVVFLRLIRVEPNKWDALLHLMTMGDSSGWWSKSWGAISLPWLGNIMLRWWGFFWQPWLPPGLKLQEEGLHPQLLYRSLPPSHLIWNVILLTMVLINIRLCDINNSKTDDPRLVKYYHRRRPLRTIYESPLNHARALQCTVGWSMLHFSTTLNGSTSMSD